MNLRLILKRLLPLLLVFIIFMGIYTLSYLYDNKYMHTAPQAIGGILFHSPQAGKPTYLINGWQYYRGKLLTPEDFETEEPPLPDKYISIGQYSGMEAGDPHASPHGSATYRMVLSLPEENTRYALELPEIYSSYRLYINNRLVAARGNPEESEYHAALKSGILTFEAFGDVTLLLAVSDWSHLYSGLVYPPAFGTPDTVASLLDFRFAWSLTITVLALILGFFQIALSVILRSFRSMLSCLICFFFAGAVCSPAVHRLFVTGIMPFYNLELFCRYAVYGTALLLVLNLSDRNRISERIASFATSLFPFAALGISFAAPFLSYPQMALFSHITVVYKIICALWMLLTALLSASRESETQEQSLLRFGICIFASSLAADRLYPLFEPVRFGWFSEIAGLVFMLLLSFLLLKDSARLYRIQLVLSQQKLQLQEQIRMQKQHYSELSSQIEAVRVMRHDFHHHVTQLALLVQEGNMEKAADYLSQLSRNPLSSSPLSFCEHYSTDVLLRYYYTRAEEWQIPVTIHANVPAQVPVLEDDLCVILGNLLENGLEASQLVEPKHRFLSVTINSRNESLAIVIKNNYIGKLHADGDNFFSSKEKGRHGIGLSSVRSTAEKYDGNVWIETIEEQGILTFTVQVLLNGTSMHQATSLVAAQAKSSVM